MPSADFYRNLLYYMLAIVRYYFRIDRDPNVPQFLRDEVREEIIETIKNIRNKL